MTVLDGYAISTHSLTLLVQLMAIAQVLLRLHRHNGRRQSELPEENFRGLNKGNNGNIIDPKKISNIMPYHFLAYENCT
jgi:hypothetical protein